MSQQKENLKNGLELLLTSQLWIELSETYLLKGLAKRYAKLFKEEIEKTTIRSYDEIYSKDPEFTINAIRLKQEMITNIAKYNEADSILLADCIAEFDKNIELVRANRAVFFNKLS
jgi:hypothetical protein